MNTRSFSRLAMTSGLICAISLGACRQKSKFSRIDVEEVPQPAPAVSADSGGTNQGGIEGVLAQRVNFRFNDADLTPEARTVLAKKAAVLRSVPGLRLRLEGHADERGSAEYNKSLGMRRAVSAKRYLMEKGVNSSRLYVTSYGKKKPLAREHTESAWSLNRRVEFGIMAEPIAISR